MRKIHLEFVLMIAVCVAAAARLSGATDTGASMISPEEALKQLMTGNQRFQTDKTHHPLLHSAHRNDLVGGQSPFAVILSCSDSRVPPELIFDQGLGGLFVVRLAGNTVTRAGLESIDYAVGHLGTKLIVVLGHDECGAVKGAISECPGKPDADLPEIFRNICPAVDLARKKSTVNLESDAIDLNVAEQVKILKQSPGFKTRVADGSLKIMGARYNLQSGKVDILDKDN
jgi:carbonic anhydrase